MDDVNPIGVDRRTTAGVGIEDVHRIEFDVDLAPWSRRGLPTRYSRTDPDRYGDDR
jgi:hypothetical protein